MTGPPAARRLEDLPGAPDAALEFLRWEFGSREAAPSLNDRLRDLPPRVALGSGRGAPGQRVRRPRRRGAPPGTRRAPRPVPAGSATGVGRPSGAVFRSRARDLRRRRGRPPRRAGRPWGTSDLSAARPARHHRPERPPLRSPGSGAPLGGERVLHLDGEVDLGEQRSFDPREPWCSPFGAERALGPGVADLQAEIAGAGRLGAEDVRASAASAETHRASNSPPSTWTARPASSATTTHSPVNLEGKCGLTHKAAQTPRRGINSKR